MSETQPPSVGQDPWGEDLNAHLQWLSQRLDVVEARPEYVYNSYAYKFNIGAPPATVNGELRLNNVDPVLATLIDLRKVDNDGADRSQVLRMLDVGSRVRINDWDNAAVLHVFDVAAAMTEDATNVQVTVAWRSGSGTLPTAGQAKINVGLLVAMTI